MIEILFEDNHMLVLNKPADLLTQPTEEVQDSLEARAKQWIKERDQKPGNVFLGAIHRLDKGASGIIVFAKTSKALSRLSASIRDQETVKMYHAIVSPPPTKDEATLEDYLTHDSHRATVVNKNVSGAKLARLHYKVLKKEKNQALLEVHLETGRYHQIRAQLAAKGSPILGDKKYGSSTAWNFPGIALHHAHFEIPHPTTKQIMKFDSKAF